MHISVHLDINRPFVVASLYVAFVPSVLGAKPYFPPLKRVVELGKRG